VNLSHLALALSSARIAVFERQAASGHLSWWPNAAMLGCADSPLICVAELIDLVHPDDRASVRHAEDRARRHPAGARAEFRVVLDGATRWFALTLHARIDGPGPEIDLVGVVMDVTDQKVATEVEDARDASRRFAGDVAHDLNNQLTTIIGFSQLVASSLDDQDQRHKDLQHVLAATERAHELATALLNFARQDDTPARDRGVRV
jgi:signal transduction histidine kinase